MTFQTGSAAIKLFRYANSAATAAWSRKYRHLETQSIAYSKAAATPSDRDYKTQQDLRHCRHLAATQYHFGRCCHPEPFLQVTDDCIETRASSHPQLCSLRAIVEPHINRFGTVGAKASSVAVIQIHCIELTQEGVSLAALTKHPAYVTTSKGFSIAHLFL